MGKGKPRVKDEYKEMKQKKLKQRKTKKKEAKKKPKVVEGVRGVIRLLETTLDGNKKIPAALLKIKGIGHSLSVIIPKVAGIDPNLPIGSLSDEQIEKLEDVIKNPKKYNIPSYLFNRRRDRETGEDKHLVESDLMLQKRADIDFMKKIRCYKGIRHELGLPVRGQRTRSSFRTGPRVGVIRKKSKK